MWASRGVVPIRVRNGTPGWGVKPRMGTETQFSEHQKKLSAFLQRHRTDVIHTVVLAHDMIASGVAFVCGLILTNTAIGPSSVLPWNMLTATGAVMVTAGALTVWMGLHRGLWRYASVPELVAIAKSTAILIVFLAGADASFGLFTAPTGSATPAMLVMGALMILFMGGTRVAYRLWRNQRVQKHNRARGNIRRVILLGASANAELFVKSARERSDFHFDVVSILDERNRRSGLSLRGIPIVGDLEQVRALCQQAAIRDEPVDSLILTKRAQVYPSKLLEQCIELASDLGLELMRLPEISDLSSESASAGLTPERLQIEDLLNRPQVKLDVSRLKNLIAGEILLVTGAGGSIGSEICRQITRFAPKRVVLVELSELALYEITQELRAVANPETTEIVPLLGDVRDRAAMSDMLEAWSPALVFHAAALKHVPIVEAQPLEGLRTNLIGTRNVADAAKAAGAKAVVILSTDKAVRPTSVMGAAKRLGEVYCQSLDLERTTRFVTVRFGNVLGSTGSVVPLFRRQIAAGGPVTVTHPDVSRYFMTIPEATQLVLHAMEYALSSNSSRGRIYALDMGRPVKIVDLARRMIILSGMKPDVDVAITFTGLRPGEKLAEELFSPAESPEGTAAVGVIAGSPPTYPIAQSRTIVEKIEDAIRRKDEVQALAAVSDAVPEAHLRRSDDIAPEVAAEKAADNVVALSRSVPT